MSEIFALQTSLAEALVRGTAVYLIIAVLFRLMPKRQTGNLSPNDLVAVIVVGSLAANAMSGGITGLSDIVLIMLTVLAWDYLFNLLEYRWPRLRGLAQDSPTLLIHNGRLVKPNLAKEWLTEQELLANLRKHGIEDIGRVKHAILEVDGQISVVTFEEEPGK